MRYVSEVDIYLVAFYLPFNIKYSTLKTKFGNKVWRDLKYFQLATIFHSSETRDEESIRDKCINFIILSIRNEMDQINIDKEYNQQQYKRKLDDEPSTSFSIKRHKWD